MEQELKRPEVARALGVSLRTLERWARLGIGPRPIKRGPRLVRYCAREVEEFRGHGHMSRPA